MSELIIEYSREQKHNIEMLKKAYELMGATGNDVKIITRTISPEIIHVPDPDSFTIHVEKTKLKTETRRYIIKPEWTLKLENNILYIISDHICSTVDLTQEEIRLITSGDNYNE